MCFVVALFTEVPCCCSTSPCEADGKAISDGETLTFRAFFVDLFDVRTLRFRGPKRPKQDYKLLAISEFKKKQMTITLKLIIFSISLSFSSNSFSFCSPFRTSFSPVSLSLSRSFTLPQTLHDQSSDFLANSIRSSFV